MKILITGGCGFLGTNLSDEAIKRGDELIVFDNLSRKGAEENLKWLNQKGRFKFYKKDIRSYDDISFALKETLPDFIFHLAGQVAMTTSIQNPRLDFETNTLGSFNLLEAVRKFSPESAIVYSSTNKVYGDLEWTEYTESSTRFITPMYPQGFPENIPLEFHSPYGCSKGAADQFMLDAHRIFGIKTVVFRHSSMYGGRQFATVDQGWIGWFCQKAVETKMNKSLGPFDISGTGKQVRDVLHAKDMISLYFNTLTKINNMAGNAFNIGGTYENSLSLIELFNFLEEQLDVRLKFSNIQPRISDQRVFVADISKVNLVSGWSPKVSVRTGLIEMINWIEELI